MQRRRDGRGVATKSGQDVATRQWICCKLSVATRLVETRYCNAVSRGGGIATQTGWTGCCNKVRTGCCNMTVDMLPQTLLVLSKQRLRTRKGIKINAQLDCLPSHPEYLSSPSSTLSCSCLHNSGVEIWLSVVPRWWWPLVCGSD